MAARPRWYRSFRYLKSIDAYFVKTHDGKNCGLENKIIVLGSVRERLLARKQIKFHGPVPKLCKIIVELEFALFPCRLKQLG